MITTSKIEVLIVEDGLEIADLVRRSLERDGCAVHLASSLADASVWLQSTRPDVIVLDVELPDGSGLDLLRDRALLRDAPVVVLSARDDEVDRVRGLELGADDYIVKPFFPKELATRVRLAARRRGSDHRPRWIDLGELTIDLDAREVHLRGRAVDLTDREFDLLAYLAASPRRVVGRDELLREVWRSSPDWQSTRTVNEHVRRLRTKIEDVPSRPRRLVTVGRIGYRFEPERS